MVHPRDLSQADNPASGGYQFVDGHRRNVAQGNNRMQAKLLPAATAPNLPSCHLATMAKPVDPLPGKRLREARDRVGITQEKLSEETGIGRSTIGGSERGHRALGRDNLMTLANYFFVPVDYFTNADDLRATAMWIVGRLPEDELQAWVTLMMARATREKLPPRD